MKPRIEKKLSKRLANILYETQGFTPKDVWVDSEYELFPVHYRHQNNGMLTAKQKRKNYEQRVRVNHIPSVGGGLDYWGEGCDSHTVFRAATEMLIWSMFIPAPFNMDDCSGGYPIVTIKLTGKNVVGLAKKYASQKSQEALND